MDFDLRAHTQLLVVSGSRAYGLHNDHSDIDLLGVAIPPARYLHGFLHRFEQANDPDAISVFAPDLTPEERAIATQTKLEGSVYALQKLARLALDCNPNILDLLFCRDAEVRRASPIGEALRAAAPRFLSRRAQHSYTGYASAQLKRIEGHRAWLLTPPSAPPRRADFGLPEQPTLPRSQRNAVAQDARDDTLTALIKRERRYGQARAHWKQYQRWKTTRNPARAALEAAHGYDTKHAAHLIRLLRMGLEMVQTGEVHVWRGDRDADELRAIRAGAWSYERLIEEATASKQQLNTLAEAGRCALPEQADREAIDALVCSWVEQALRQHLSR